MTVKELAIKLKDLVAEGKGDVQIMFKVRPVTYPIFSVNEVKNPEGTMPVYHWIVLEPKFAEELNKKTSDPSPGT